MEFKLQCNIWKYKKNAHAHTHTFHISTFFIYQIYKWANELTNLVCYFKDFIDCSIDKFVNCFVDNSIYFLNYLYIKHSNVNFMISITDSICSLSFSPPASLPPPTQREKRKREKLYLHFIKNVQDYFIVHHYHGRFSYIS